MEAWMGFFLARITVGRCPDQLLYVYIRECPIAVFDLACICSVVYPYI